jgi:hypothetical protein
MDDNHDAHGHQVPSAAFVSIYGGNLPAKFVNRNLKAQTMATPANSTVDPTATSIVFGPFRLSPMQRLLTEAGTPIHLGSRALDMLVALLERSGELVSKEELHSASAVGRAETVHEQVQKLQQTTLAHHCRLGRAFVLAIGVVGRRAYLGAEFRAAGNQETTGGSAIESHKLKCSE